MGLQLLLGGGGLVHAVRGAEDARLKRGPLKRGPATARPLRYSRDAAVQHRRAVRPCPPSSGPLPLLSMLFIRHGGLGRGERRATFIFVGVAFQRQRYCVV